MTVVDDKEHLRRAIRERLAKMRPQDRTAESRTLCKELLHLLSPSPLSIAGFVSLPDEPDIRPLLQQLLDRGDAVYLPFFDGKGLAMRRVTDLQRLRKGPLNILEPAEDGELLDPATLDIALVPGQAFTREGARLGRGNGGYDVWIHAQRTANGATKFYGVALECQLVTDLPMESHDQRLDGVMTARGLAE